MKAPELDGSELLVYNVPGPVIRGQNHDVTYESYNLSLVSHYSTYLLLVRHGGGQERIELGTTGRYLKDILPKLPEVEAFSVLFTIYKAYSKGKMVAASETESKYRLAFAEGRLKKRKIRGQDRCKIWIEMPITKEDRRYA